jgi:PAS domain S-box-containing protein
MKRAPRQPWPLRVQLLVLSLMIAAPLCALLGFDLYRDFQRERRDAGAAALDFARIAAQNCETFIADARRTLEVLAQRAAVRALDRNACEPLLGDIQKLQPRFRNALTVDRNGALVCSALAPVPATAPGPDPVYWFNRVRESMQFTVGTPALGFISKRWVVTLAYPLRDARGEFIGAVALSVDLADYPVLPAAAAGLPDGLVVGIASYAGLVIARSSDAQNLVGRPIGDTPVRAAALASKTGHIEAPGMDGVRRIYGFTPIPGTGWYAVAGIPAEVVYASRNARLLRNGLLAFAVILLATAAAYVLGRRIEQPLRRIANAADAVAAGNRDARAPPGGSREAVVLSAQFNATLEALIASEQRFRETFENVRLAGVTLDAQGNVTHCNNFLLELTGWRRDELVGRNWFTTMLPDPAPVRAMFDQAMRDGNLPPHYENAINTRAGGPHMIHWNNIILRDPARGIAGAASLGEDVTARLRLEERNREQLAELSHGAAEGRRLLALAEKSRRALLNVLEDQKSASDELREAHARMQALSHRILEIQETERQHISRELHDEVAQSLAVELMQLHMAMNGAPAPLKPKLTECVDTVEQTLRQVRAICRALRPPQIDDLGLIDALRAHLQRQEEIFGLKIEFRAAALKVRPHSNTEIACFRIVQEAVTNICHHADARNAWVDLSEADGELRLTVRDDGSGFDLEEARDRAASSGRMGMTGMAERAALAGGRLEINAAPGRGTEVRVNLPLHPVSGGIQWDTHGAGRGRNDE